MVVAGKREKMGRLEEGVSIGERTSPYHNGRENLSKEIREKEERKERAKEYFPDTYYLCWPGTSNSFL